jgi:hypothetical protein
MTISTSLTELSSLIPLSPKEINKTITKNRTRPTNEAKIPPEIYLFLARNAKTDSDEFAVSVAIFN